MLPDQDHLPEGFSVEELEGAPMLGSSPAARVGQTFLVRRHGRWVALWRDSTFDCFQAQDLDAKRPFRIDGEGLTQRLILTTSSGEHLEIEVSPMESERVRDALAAAPVDVGAEAEPFPAATLESVTFRPPLIPTGENVTEPHPGAVENRERELSRRPSKRRRRQRTLPSGTAHKGRPLRDSSVLASRDRERILSGLSPLERETVELLQAGQYRDAIRIYQEAARLTYVRARNSVDDLARRLGIPVSKSDLPVLVAAGLIVAGVLVLLVLLMR